MAESIITPGYLEIPPANSPELTTPQYLERNNYLTEYDGDKNVHLIRNVLNVYSKDEVYSLVLADTNLGKAILDAFNKYLNLDDPPISEETARQIIEEALTGYVRKIEQNKFLEPAREYTDTELREHINSEDPHRIIPEVEDILELYAKQSDIYFKNLLYTKNEIDGQSGQYVKKDGSVPFIKPQGGADPQIDSHLATKRYADKILYNHLVDVDPHGFISILNNRLASYAKTKDVWDKTQTYSRVLLDSIIRGLVNDAAQEAIQDHLNKFDPHHILDEVRKQKYIKLDGTIPFRSPQKGVDAVDPLDLVTLHQVEEKVTGAVESIPSTTWITSGPVEATVGHVEDRTIVPLTMTLLEIMDAIFYGKTISLDVPEYVTITESCEVTLCIHGSTGLILYAELYQDGKLIYTVQKEEFESGCVTVDSLPILLDTEFTFKVFYTNGSVHEETKIVGCGLPVFVGLLPKWKSGYTITMDYLHELCNEDPEGVQNRFLSYGPNLKSFTFKYLFLDSNLRHPFVVLPVNYPNLDTMVTKSLSFGIEAFDVIDMIPLQIQGVEEDVIFKVYIYSLALSSLNLEVTFNFKPNTK